MAKSNPFGIFNPQVFKVKKNKLNLHYYAFLFIRSDFDDLSMLTKLYHHTQFLLKKSPLDLVVDIETTGFSFTVYRENDILPGHPMLMIKNKSLENSIIQWIGFDKGSLYTIHRAKSKCKIPQLNIPLEDTTDLFMDENESDENLEIANWEANKRILREQSVAFEGRIDYVIPLDISTYEYFMPFFLALAQFVEINYQLVEASEFENFEAIHYILESYADSLQAEENKRKKEKFDKLK
jgi:hypothetical protein